MEMEGHKISILNERFPQGYSKYCLRFAIIFPYFDVLLLAVRCFLIRITCCILQYVIFSQI